MFRFQRFPVAMPRARTTVPPAASAVAASAARTAATGSSAERSLRLLALLANEGRALSLAELALRMGLPKATAHRLCGQLLDGGFLVRDTAERCFAVGPASSSSTRVLESSLSRAASTQPAEPAPTTM